MNTRNGVSAWCIDHPIATLLLTFALVLLGAIAFRACRSPRCPRPTSRPSRSPPRCPAPAPRPWPRQ